MSAHATPDAVLSADFCSPDIPPPAPTKQPRPTSTGQSCNGSFPKWEITAHRATTSAMLSALVVNAFIGRPPERGRRGANIMNGALGVQTLRGAGNATADGGRSS